MYDSNNVFAKIIRGELPSKKVAETEKSMAFFDIKPVARIHILVIPKGKYMNIVEFIANASMEEQRDFWNLVKDVAGQSCNCDNFRLTAYTGERAGQTVPHFHVHIIAD